MYSCEYLDQGILESIFFYVYLQRGGKSASLKKIPIMFDFLDVVKWKNPQNEAERQDLMVVEDTTGVYVQVRHVEEDAFGNVSNELMEQLRKVGKTTAYEKAESLYKRLVNA